MCIVLLRLRICLLSAQEFNYPSSILRFNSAVAVITEDREANPVASCLELMAVI